MKTKAALTLVALALFAIPVNSAGILWLQNNDAIDTGWKTLLEDNGHTLTAFTGNRGLPYQAGRDYVNSFDLVVIAIQVTITRNPDTPGSFDFTRASQPDKHYDLLTSTDLADPISEWPVYNDGETLHEAIPTVGETITRTAVPSTDPRRFFAVREYDAPPPPPLLEENF